jgi:hypothetical protein
MPLSLPNLDDRRYEDLLEEARSLIPSYAPEWTNHNPSDPGITLVELFAYLTEMLVYRVNRVTDDNKRAFLKLIIGPKREVNRSRPLGDEIRDVVLELRRPVRAVTVEDYERLAVAAHKSVARARCLPLRNLKAPNPFKKESEGHVSVVVVTTSAPETGTVYTLAALAVVAQLLERGKLLTTRLHVVEPRYVGLSLKATLQLKPGALERGVGEGPPEKQTRGVTELAVEALTEFFHPLRGGPDRSGWPFGRSIYVSEVYALLDKLPGVDYVSSLTLDLTAEPGAGETAGDLGAERRKMRDGKLYAFALEPDELVRALIVEDDITAERPKVEEKFDLTKHGSK